MAATYPADVAEAARWVETNPGKGGDAAVSAVQSQVWDSSVQFLVAFPQVLATMNQDPGWVQGVGDAYQLSFRILQDEMTCAPASPSTRSLIGIDLGLLY